jgi:hypothetical protein
MLCRWIGFERGVERQFIPGGCKRCSQAVKVRARARVLTAEDHSATQLDPSPFTLSVRQAERISKIITGLHSCWPSRCWSHWHILLSYTVSTVSSPQFLDMVGLQLIASHN